jgi:two-component system sensor histidine kinase HydH
MLRLGDMAAHADPTPRRLGRAELAVALAAGAILLASAAFGWWNARQSAHVLAGGHGEHLLHEIRRAHPPTGAGLDDAAVDALVRRLAADGLRCLTVFEPDFRLRARRGDCRLDPEDLRPGPELHPGAPRSIGGGRFAMIHMLPPPGDDRMPHRFPFVVEYDAPPVAALWTTTYATTFASVVAALVLVAATILNRRLTGRAAELQSALAREQHLAALGEASAVLAHELRNPLSSIKGHAQLMVEQLGGDAPTRERADILVREALRLEALCEQLLSFVRAGRIERVESDPGAVLRDAVASVDGTRIDVSTEQAPKRWALDPLRMHQALSNLLQNALQAAPAARGTASARLEDDTLVYEVRDRGPGVAAEELGRIFEPFHTTRVRGTGLGLAVARRVVELHGGRIDVRNHPDGGAVFSVRLPSASVT